MADSEVELSDRVLAYIDAHPGATAVDMFCAGLADIGSIALFEPLCQLEERGLIKRQWTLWSEHVRDYPRMHTAVMPLVAMQATEWVGVDR